MTLLRVGYLWTWLIALTLGAGYSLLSADQRAAIEARVADGERTIAPRASSFAGYVHAVGAGVAALGPALGAGLALGALCHAVLGVRAWAGRQAARAVHRVGDRYGCELTMHRAPLDDVTDGRDHSLRRLPVQSLPAGVSPIEHDAIARFVTQRDVPFDPREPSQGSVAEAALRAWLNACERSGAGSLDAQVALCAYLGRLRAVVREGARWTALGPWQAFGLQAVRDLEAFTALAPSDRSALMSVLTALLTGCVPVGLTETQRAVLYAARQAQGDGAQTLQASPAAGSAASIEAIVDRLRSRANALLAALNVERYRDHAAPLEGCYLDEHAVVLVPATALRRRFEQHLPIDVASLLAGGGNEFGAQRGLTATLDVARQLFQTTDVLGAKRALDGTFRFRCGTRVYTDALAICTTRLPPTLIARWKGASHAIDLL